MKDLGLALAPTTMVVIAAGAFGNPEGSQRQRSQRRASQPRQQSHSVPQPIDQSGDQIPNFSNCGYEGGGVDLLSVPVRVTVAPLQGDAQATIQQAIEEVSALPLDQNGISGAVLLKRGRYRIGGSLHITASGVVIRGEGSGQNGTVLIATGTSRRTLIEVGNRSRWREVKGSRRQATDAYVPVGARRFRLESSEGLKIGSRIMIHRPSTREWIHVLGMDRIPPRKDGGQVVQWTPGSKDLHFDRVVTAIEGEQITIDAPITCAGRPVWRRLGIPLRVSPADQPRGAGVGSWGIGIQEPDRRGTLLGFPRHSRG